MRDTKILTSQLIALLLLEAKLADTEEKAFKMIEDSVSSGKALAKLEEIIIAQGGDARVLEDYSLLGTSKVKLPIFAETSGYVKSIDSRAIGYALVRIKAGRMKVSDAIDYGAGALLIPKIGDYLKQGEPIGEIHANDAAKAEEVAALVRAAYEIVAEPVEKEKLIFDIE